MAAVLSIDDTSERNQRHSCEEIKLIYASFLGKGVAVTTNFHGNTNIVARSLATIFPC